MLALLRLQAAQLLLFLATKLPKRGAIELTSLLQACLPLLRAQLPHLPRLLRAQLMRLRAVGPARRQRRLGSGLPQVLRRARRWRGMLCNRAAATARRMCGPRRVDDARRGNAGRR
ncbi:MAG: hypothetical protein ACJ8D0_06010, partial [Xanthobacteraceae bacterium]